MDTAIVLTAKYLYIVIALVSFLVGLTLSTQQKRELLIWLGLSGIMAFLLTKGAGAIYYDPRPFTHGVHALISHDADNGFPSDHTVLTSLLAFLIFRYRRGLGLVLLVGAVLVGTSRVAAGIHRPLDIVAGVSIALLASVSALLFAHRLGATRAQ